MAHAPVKCSFAGIANITCGSSRGKDNFFLLNKCVVQVKNHLRSYNLSRSTKVTEYDLILARAGNFNRSHEEKMVVCLAYRHSPVLTPVLFVFGFFFVFFFLSKNWLGMGKWIKGKIQILLRFVRQAVRGAACHAMFTTQ